MAISEAAADKAPGPDGIPNRILREVSHNLAPSLHKLFNAYLDQGYYPKHFKKSTTIALRKPGKDDYTDPKSYRPIALLNTIGKILDKIVARRISYAVETHQTLPPNHMGGRRGMGTEHAIHRLIQKVHEAWGKQRPEVTSLLLLDVSGAFDHVSHERLLHNLKKRRLDGRTVAMIASLLKGRSTMIQLPDFTAESTPVNTGIPQGSPLSPILYLYYNADLAEVTNREENSCHSTAYIDDIGIQATGLTTEETCQKLAAAHEKCIDWARKHAAKFAPQKYELIHFTRAITRHDKTQALMLQNDTSVQPNNRVRYLGVLLDSKLQWRPQLEKIKMMAAKSIAALSCLAGSTWGTGLLDLRRLYKTTIMPQLLYGSSAWLAPSRKGNKHIREALEAIQGKALKVVTGAYRAASYAALNIEANVPPITITADRLNKEAALRLYTTREQHRLQVTWDHREAGRGRGKKGQTPLEAIWHQLHLQSDTAENKLKNTERIRPYLVQPWWKPPTTRIESSADAAIQQHDSFINSQDGLAIYSDGSGINGKIGAAAVCPAINATEDVYLGSSKHFTVYAAELAGIAGALLIAQRRGYDHTKVHIYTDNQAAIRAVRNPQRQSGQYFLEMIMGFLQKLQEMGIAVELHWIPAHKGVEGNEAADTAAKEVTGWSPTGDSEPAQAPLDIPILAAAGRTSIRQQSAADWAKQWHEETKGRNVYRICKQPTRKVERLHRGMSKATSSLIVQMRTAKIGLNAFLHAAHVPDVGSDRCACGQSAQTVEHVLMACRQQRERRIRFRDDERRCRQASGDERIADDWLDPDMTVTLSTPKLAQRAARFMASTGLLGQFRALERTH
jgi:ribonuclease HI